jgi:hypothetical protein
MWKKWIVIVLHCCSLSMESRCQESARCTLIRNPSPLVTTSQGTARSGNDVAIRLNCCHGVSQVLLNSLSKLTNIKQLAIDTMAGAAPHGAGAHPVHVHPARPFYRFAATALGASMWFFVRHNLYAYYKRKVLMSRQLFYRMKKDGPTLLGWKHPWDH